MNIVNFILIKILVATTTMLLTSCGNSALHWIQDGDKIIVPGSEIIVAQKLQIENIKPPTEYTPTISFNITQVDKVNSSSYYKLIEVEKEWSRDSGYNFVVWTAGWILLAAPLWVYFTDIAVGDAEQEIKIPPPTKKGEKKGMWGGKENWRININWYPTGKEKDGEIKNENLENKLTIKNSTVTAKINNTEIEFLTDYFGQVKVDLIKDFNLVKSENDIPIEFVVSDMDKKLSASLYLKPSDWMVEYIKATSNDVEVMGEYGKGTVKLGKLKPGEEYRLLHKGSQLWKIDYKEKEGFIPPNSGEVFWAVLDYLQFSGKK